MILAILAVVTASFQPPAPRVGDLVTVTFPAPVVLEASREYEIVSRRGNVLVVRTFEPRAFALHGTMGPLPAAAQRAAGGAKFVRFRNLRVPVRSVLKQQDDLAPAPLAPPQRPAWPELPWVLGALAALALLAVWFLWRKRKARKAPIVAAAPALAPDERFRHAVHALLSDPSHPLRWAALADATRAWLAATRPGYGSELTTSELIPLLVAEEQVVEAILHQGDLEKFSTRGAGPADFDAVADAVLQLAAARNDHDSSAAGAGA